MSLKMEKGLTLCVLFELKRVPKKMLLSYVSTRLSNAGYFLALYYANGERKGW